MSQKTEVLYNAQCPVCSFEIDHYRSCAQRRGLAIGFDDLNACDLARWGLTPDQAARRLYLRQGDKLVSGMPAFRLLWQSMPRYRWLAWLTGLPGLRQASVWGYDRVLAPLIYRWHLRRQALLAKPGADVKL